VAPVALVEHGDPAVARDRSVARRALERPGRHRCWRRLVGVLAHNLQGGSPGGDETQARTTTSAADEGIAVHDARNIRRAGKQSRDFRHCPITEFPPFRKPSGFEPYIVNGVSFKVGMYSPAEVDRYAKLEPEMVAEQGKWPIHSADAEYFTYGVKQDDASGRTEYHHDAIVVGKHGNSQYEVIVLYPQVRTADGEMEAALFYHSGEFRAPSFAEVMRQLSILETQPVDHVPPYPQSMLHGTCAEKLPIKDVWWE